MHIEEILTHFNDTNGRFPKEALNAAVEQQESITPYLLSIVKNVVVNYETVDVDKMDYVFALYLLSKFREKEAFPYIIEIASLPDSWPEYLLEDIITEALARFIVSTFNDDLDSVKKLIENPNLNEWSRNAALKSLLGLIALGKLSRNELIDYFRMLFHSPLANDNFFMTHLIDIASYIYPEELMNEINKAFEEDKVDIFYVDMSHINSMLEMGKEECLNKNVYQDKHNLPIDDVEVDMKWMFPFGEKKNGDIELKHFVNQQFGQVRDDDVFEFQSSTYIRSAPKTGRNHPCHCGSGVKFKKCCLS